MFDGLYFEFPKIAFVIFFFVACETLCKMRLTSIYFPHLRTFAGATHASSKLLFFLKWLAIVMLILALMSPVKDEKYELDPKEGYEIVLILDASQSMSAQGFDMSNIQSNRFDVVKEIVSDFIQKRKSDNMGLIVFGEFSFIASPLTYDEHILSRIVQQLYIGVAGKYTALNSALAQGVSLLKNTRSKSKVAILLTDGYSTKEIDKIPQEVAIEMAKKEGVKVYPIGIGLPHEYNSQALMEIAKASGGVAFGAANAKELQAVYERIDELEKSEIKNESFNYLHYFYAYPLFIGLISLMLYVYLRNKRGHI